MPGAPVENFIASPDGSKLYAIGMTKLDGTRSISEIDVATTSVTNSITISSDGMYANSDALTLSPDGSRLYVANHWEGVTVVDTSRFAVIDTIAIGRGAIAAMAVTRDGEELHVATYNPGSTNGMVHVVNVAGI
jgi:YVTN family beta-propeller protein